MISIGCLAAAAATAQGVAPVAPAPAVAPVPAPALRVNADYVDASALALEAQDRVQEKLAEVQERLALAQQDMNMRFQTPFPYVQTTKGNQDSLYERGQSALDRHRWDEALADFSQAASQAGGRADGALYWKAYTLNKLGRRDDALAVIAELGKSYPSSRWLNDAAALKLEVMQANGQPASPDAQSDEDLKLMALNGLMQSDPDRALTALDSLLKSGQSPKLKEQALFVLAQSRSPKAEQMLEQVARGAGNPDLQLRAISFLGPLGGRKGDAQSQRNYGQLLFEIYGSSSDVNVKRAVLTKFGVGRDVDHLLQIAKTEKDAELRRDAIRRLTSLRDPSLDDALVGIYGSEQDKEVKRAIASSFANNGDVKHLVAVARTEKDPEMVRYIVGELSRMKSPEAADYLMEILKK
jgi:tetratricopeptide (TPR) repeat protein